MIPTGLTNFHHSDHCQHGTFLRLFDLKELFYLTISPTRAKIRHGAACKFMQRSFLGPTGNTSLSRFVTPGTRHQRLSRSSLWPGGGGGGGIPIFR